MCRHLIIGSQTTCWTVRSLTQQNQFAAVFFLSEAPLFCHVTGHRISPSPLPRNNFTSVLAAKSSVVVVVTVFV